MECYLTSHRDLDTVQMLSGTAIDGATRDLEFLMYDEEINKILKKLDNQYTHETCPIKLRLLTKLVIIIEKIHYLIWFIALKHYNVVYSMNKDYVQTTNNDLFPYIQRDLESSTELTLSPDIDKNMFSWEKTLFNLTCYAFPANTIETHFFQLKSNTFKTKIVSQYFSQKMDMIRNGEHLVYIQ